MFMVGLFFVTLSGRVMNLSFVFLFLEKLLESIQQALSEIAESRLSNK